MSIYTPHIQEVAGFAIGFKVRVKDHYTTTLYGDHILVSSSGKEGFVVGFSKDYDWRHEPNQAQVRLMYEQDPETGEFHYAYNMAIDLVHLEVVEAVAREVIVGKTCPYSRQELQEMFVAQQLEKIEQHDFKVEGYKNMATYLAAVYLNQNSQFHRQLDSLRRANGTINPNKVAKAFTQLGLSIDSQAFEPPIVLSTPERFRYQAIVQALNKHQAVDWDEVAEDFSVELT